MTTNENETPAEETVEETDGFTPIVSQADLDRIVQARIARVESKYADYEENKLRLKEIEDASKSDLEKALARAEAAEQELNASRRRSLILEAASKFGVPSDYVNLITGDDEESINLAAEQVGTLASKNAEEDSESKMRFIDPGQSSNTAPPDEQAVKEAFARQIFQV